MKKALPLALLLATGLGLAACDKKEEPQAPTTPPATEQPSAPAPSTPPATEPAPATPATPSTAPAPSGEEQEGQ